MHLWSFKQFLLWSWELLLGVQFEALNTTMAIFWQNSKVWIAKSILLQGVLIQIALLELMIKLQLLAFFSWFNKYKLFPRHMMREFFNTISIKNYFRFAILLIRSKSRKNWQNGCLELVPSRKLTSIAIKLQSEITLLWLI